MLEPIFVLETSSAHLRELLREACARLAQTATFASSTAARRALAAGAPAVFVVGGAPLDPAAAELLEAAAVRGISCVACVQPGDLTRALLLGAVDTCERSEAGVQQLSVRVASLLPNKLRSAAPAPYSRSFPAPRAQSLPAPHTQSLPAPHTQSLPAPRTRSASISAPCRLIAIGASTGGPDAIAFLLSRLPTTLPGIVIVQHMPGAQTGAFAQRLAEQSKWKVREAHDGDGFERGTALIAPGGQHIRVQRGGRGVDVGFQGPATRHVPSVNVFFESVARELTISALGVLLTGMGDDGALGLLAMRQAGAQTLAQSAQTCAVYGMPRRAVEIGAASEVVALEDLPERLAVCSLGALREG
jgi:two-component system chemotaxis response regulator CheB